MKSLFGLLLIFTCLVEAQTITTKNWQNHPAILEIRAIYKAVNAQIAAKKLKLEQTGTGGCPSWDLERSQYTDAKGLVRRYIKAGGSEDSAVTLEHTYDAQGRLRFVLVTAGAVNDTHLEERFYFDMAGKRLWSDRRETGPGYTFSEEDFLRELVWNPKRAFTAALPCR
jgi:hypothetical protein